MHYKLEYTDEQMYHLLKTGGRDAFACVFDRYRKRLFTEAYYMLKSEDDALDVVQETFVFLWQKRVSLQINLSLQNYLLGIVRYKCIDVLEKRSKADKLRTTYARFSEVATGLDAKMEQDEQERQKLNDFQKIKVAINTIRNPNRRLAIQKRYLEQKTVQDISTEMGYPEQTVRNWLTSGIKYLHDKIAKKL